MKHRGARCRNLGLYDTLMGRTSRRSAPRSFRAHLSFLCCSVAAVAFVAAAGTDMEIQATGAPAFAVGHAAVPCRTAVTGNGLARGTAPVAVPMPRGQTAPNKGMAPLSPSMFAGIAVAVSVGLAVRRAACRSGVHRGVRAVTCVAAASALSDIGVVLLSGGVGKRMGAKIPKQYLKLLGLEIALHSLKVFLESEVAEIAIVCAEEWRSVFEDFLAEYGEVKSVIKYTSGGKERQDSVQNGLAEITTEYVAVHDAARPLVTKDEIMKVVADAREYGAALLAVQTKATIKQTDCGSGKPFVKSTPNRKELWEAHTPQVLRADLLREGFKNAVEKGLEVTDDVSLVEALGKPVKLTEGEYTNLKVTTPEDIMVAETILRSRDFSWPS